MLFVKKWIFALMLGVLAISACTAGGAAGEPTEPPITEEPTTEVQESATPEPTPLPTEGINDLAGTSWVLTQINGAAPVEGSKITLVFEDMTLGGQACNGYGGDYTANSGTLTVGELISTLMACPEPAGVMEQETAYHAALREATRYVIAGDQLTLGTEANPSTLVFVAGEPETQSPDGWVQYQDDAFGFTLRHPDSGVAVNTNPPTVAGQNSVRIDLPFTPNTNLSEKYLQIDTYTGTDVCASPHSEGYADDMLNPGEVTLGDITWKTHTAGGAGAGNFYEWFAYSTSHNGNCVVLTFVLHSVNVGNFSTPPAEFDRAAEMGVFEEIVSTFAWSE